MSGVRRLNKLRNSKWSSQEKSPGISLAGLSNRRAIHPQQRRLGSVLPRTFLLCHKTGTLPQVRQCRAGTGDLKNAPRIAIPIQINTFWDFGSSLRFGPNDAFSLCMRHLLWLEYKPRTDYRVLNRTSRENTPGLPSWRLTPGCPARFKPFHRWWTV